MKFWDSSAILPLIVEEPRSREIRALAERDPAIAVWWSTRTECASAVWRRVRDGGVPASEVQRAQATLRELTRWWSEVQPRDRIRSVADRILAVHELRAADALQLAAALDWCDANTDGAGIICLDRRLRAAAQREGFLVLPERD